MSRLRLRTFPSNVTDVSRVREREVWKMKKTKNEKYWENEVGEVVEFGKHFMRCFEKAGKLQLGFISKIEGSDKVKYLVKFVLDREELINSKEGAEYLMQTIEDWKNEADD